MCLIAMREAGSGANIPNKVIDYNMRKNPDGFGIAWREKGKLLFEKFGPKETKAFRKLLKKVDAKKGTEFVAHWRFATHGPVCKDMSHPFQYESNGEQTLVFHNGIINNSPPKDESDTSYFVKTVLSGLVPLWWKNPAYTELVEKYIGWSRLVIMTPNETFRMVENDWKQQGGIFYSIDPLPYSTTPVSAGRNYTPPALLTSGKGYSAADAWKTWEDGLEADTEFGFDDDDSDGYELLPTHFPTDYKHEGHDVSRVSESTPVEFAGEAQGNVICNPCGTLGKYYRIAGQTFTELAHLGAG